MEVDIDFSEQFGIECFNATFSMVLDHGLSLPKGLVQCGKLLRCDSLYGQFSNKALKGKSDGGEILRAHIGSPDSIRYRLGCHAGIDIAHKGAAITSLPDLYEA